MSVWKFVVPAPNSGERNVPAPKTAEVLGIPSGQVLVKRTGTWVHEEDWPYLKSLQFPCRGVMKDGLMIGCPDSRQITTRPPEPAYEPPPAFFETPPIKVPEPATSNETYPMAPNETHPVILDEDSEEEAVEPKPKRKRSRR